MIKNKPHGIYNNRQKSNLAEEKETLQYCMKNFPTIYSFIIYCLFWQLHDGAENLMRLVICIGDDVIKGEFRSSANRWSQKRLLLWGNR